MDGFSDGKRQIKEIAARLRAIARRFLEIPSNDRLRCGQAAVFPDTVLDRAESRKELVEAALAYQRASGKPVKEAVSDFVTMLNAARMSSGRGLISPEITGRATCRKTGSISFGSVYRWMTSYRKFGLPGLADGYTQPGGESSGGKIALEEQTMNEIETIASELEALSDRLFRANEGENR
jgi:hypothetical protein